MQFFSYIIIHPLWLSGAIILLISFILLLQKKAQKQNFGDIELLQEVYKKNTWWYRGYIVLLLCITLGYIVALSGLYIVGESEKTKKDGIDIEIVFDVSYSMIAKDIEPTRIEAAKKVFSDFVGKLETDRVGLILFAGKPFQSIPLNYDYSFLRDFIEKVDVESIDQSQTNLQGTAIGDALVLAAGVLEKEDPEREKIIILLTDGTANRGVDPALALKLLQEKEIKTYTIGVGKDKETTIDIVVSPGFIQRTPVGGVDEVILQKIASETGGEYFRADSETSLENILKTIGDLEKSELEIEQYHFYSSLLYKILGIIFIFYGGLGFFIFVKKIRI